MDKKIPPHKETAFEEINQKFTGNHTKQQCARMLQAMRLFKLNTFEASRGLNVYHPPARILQLRQQGYAIDTIWETVEAENGVKHRVGCYVLRPGKNHE